jgi:hypothetical protein
MVALLACRGGVRTFAAACDWRSSLACLLGALAAAPGSVAMLAHRRIAFRAALARWRFRFQAVIKFFGFLCTHHSHVGEEIDNFAFDRDVLLVVAAGNALQGIVPSPD